MKGVPGTVDKGTAIMRSRPGVQPSKTVQKGSTAERTPVTRGSAHTAKARDVDMSDRGVKGLKPTRDRGKKGLPAQKG